MKVNIFLNTSAENDEGCDKSEFFTTGEFEVVDDSFVIRYDENGEIGYEDCSVTLSVRPELIVIERTGAASSALYIDKNHKHHCVYGTPFGDFTLGVNAYEIENELTEEGGKLYVRYGIDLNTDFISENKINITVTKAD